MKDVSSLIRRLEEKRKIQIKSAIWFNKS